MLFAANARSFILFLHLLWRTSSDVSKILFLLPTALRCLTLSVSHHSLSPAPFLSLLLPTFSPYLLPFILPPLSLLIGLLFSDIGQEESEAMTSFAMQLYGLIHARYILTTHGLAAMHHKYLHGAFGKCPRHLCAQQSVVPVSGIGDEERSSERQRIREIKLSLCGRANIGAYATQDCSSKKEGKAMFKKACMWLYEEKYFLPVSFFPILIFIAPCLRSFLRCGLFLFELQLGHHCDPHHDTVKIYCPKVRCQSCLIYYDRLTSVPETLLLQKNLLCC